MGGLAKHTGLVNCTGGTAPDLGREGRGYQWEWKGEKGMATGQIRGLGSRGRG